MPISFLWSKIGLAIPWMVPNAAYAAPGHLSEKRGRDRRWRAAAKRREVPKNIPDVVRIVEGEAAYPTGWWKGLNALPNIGRAGKRPIGCQRCIGRAIDDWIRACSIGIIDD